MKEHKKKSDREIDQEIIHKGRDVLKDFDHSKAFGVEPKKSESKLISIRLPMEMMQSLRHLAVRRGDVGYQQLIKIYITEGLLHDQLRMSETFIYPQSEEVSGESSAQYASFSNWGQPKIKFMSLNEPDNEVKYGS